MPPKITSLSLLGRVHEHGDGWRADMQLSSTERARGPVRVSKAEAEADLHAMRASGSRANVFRVVAELVPGAVAASARLVVQSTDRTSSPLRAPQVPDPCVSKVTEPLSTKRRLRCSSKANASNVCAGRDRGSRGIRS